MMVWAEIDPYSGHAIRIFRDRKALVESGVQFFTNVEKGLAVSQIRRAVFTRQERLCIRCGTVVTWGGSLFARMHMHEKKFKSQGGEVSLENCEGLCYSCHLGPRGKHPEKRVFTK